MNNFTDAVEYYSLHFTSFPLFTEADCSELSHFIVRRMRNNEELDAEDEDHVWQQLSDFLFDYHCEGEDMGDEDESRQRVNEYAAAHYYE